MPRILANIGRFAAHFVTNTAILNGRVIQTFSTKKLWFQGFAFVALAGCAAASLILWDAAFAIGAALVAKKPSPFSLAEIAGVLTALVGAATAFGGLYQWGRHINTGDAPADMPVQQPPPPPQSPPQGHP